MRGSHGGVEQGVAVYGRHYRRVGIEIPPTCGGVAGLGRCMRPRETCLPPRPHRRRSRAQLYPPAAVSGSAARLAPVPRPCPATRAVRVPATELRRTAAAAAPRQRGGGIPPRASTVESSRKSVTNLHSLAPPASTLPPPWRIASWDRTRASPPTNPTSTYRKPVAVPARCEPRGQAKRWV